MAKSNSSTPDAGFIIPLGFLLLLAPVFAYVTHEAAGAYAVAQQQMVEEIANEDRATCEQFGMGYRTREFQRCSEQLAIVRQKQSDRDHAAAEGIL